MSRTTKEISRITGSVIRVSLTLLVVCFVFFLLWEGAVRGYRFGYETFTETRAEAAPGMDMVFDVMEGESRGETAKRLERLGLIRNRYSFLVLSEFYGYKVLPGVYQLNTSMTIREILERLDSGGTG